MIKALIIKLLDQMMPSIVSGILWLIGRRNEKATKKEEVTNERIKQADDAIDAGDADALNAAIGGVQDGNRDSSNRQQ